MTTTGSPIGDKAALLAEYQGRSLGANGGAYAVAVAVLALAEAQDRTAEFLKWLGTGDAATTMGAIEAHGAFVREGLKAVADGLGALAAAIEEHE
jgi:hypothetical protein